MDTNEFRRHAHELVDWMADYLESVREYPVKSAAAPKEIFIQIPPSPPANGESFEQIFRDFEKIILPGMTHWQHPSFFAYFPANSSPPSLLAEMLMSTIGAQCMSWQTSPAATELEERVMQWLGQMLALPPEFVGVIQDTASTATLCSILTARERWSNFGINESGLRAQPQFIVYASAETHSSVEKAVKIAGLGRANYRKIDVDDNYAMAPNRLAQAIERDIAAGRTPLVCVATIGTTGSTAIDPLRAIGEICRQYGIWLHVDAAFAGTALILPEMRWMIDGIEYADTFVFNPHKWMLTNFDCTAYFVRDPAALVQTFEILPEYLKTAEGDRVHNYRDWGLPLGRRFRALKLWFVIRSLGVSGLQEIIQRHIAIAHELRGWIEACPDFELLAPTPLALVCFRYRPTDTDPGRLDQLNARLLETLNATGKLYITHTKLNGRFALRLVTAQTNVTLADVRDAWNLIQSTARRIS